MKCYEIEFKDALITELSEDGEEKRISGGGFLFYRKEDVLEFVAKYDRLIETLEQIRDDTDPDTTKSDFKEWAKDILKEIEND